MKRTQRPAYLAKLWAIVAMAVAAQAAAEPDRTQWDLKYAHARADLVDGREDQAEAEFERLAANAPSPEDARRAAELAEICRSKLRRDADAAQIRTPQELTMLYTTAFVYGLGTSTWVALMTEPKNMAGAVLPFAVLTTASVGSVALFDGYRPFKRGVPQSIATGVFLGFGEGIWAVGLQHAVSSRLDNGSTWGDKEAASVLWGGATLGAAGGALVGSLRNPTPGRVSFTFSTSLWGGFVSSFAADALTASGERRSENAFLSGLVGYNVGLASGLIFAPRIAPSVARVRFVDLGGITGGLVGAGTYTLLVGETGRARATFGASAIGATLGLGLTWWATSSMPGDPQPKHDTIASTLMPNFVRTADGWSASVSGLW